MSWHRRRELALFPVFLALAIQPGCVSPRDKSRQLSRVAKDWCLTIRASQVIPAYPLTEDLLPGDVFLTTTPVGAEVDLFEERGFLPLDNHLVRLASDQVFGELEGFYAARFDVGSDGFPRRLGWDHVPEAKFPTYTFEISRAGGLNLAIPVQGVPVGLSYLGAAKATGSVTISEAGTLGADIDRLNPVLDAWAKDRKDLLAPYGSLPGDPESEPVFVRVVSRIYTTGKVNVHLADADTNAAEVQAGVERPLSLPASDPTARTTAERQQETVGVLNAALQPQFGGRLRVVNANSRSITLEEDFARPVVIGYLAFDRQILPDGTLGAPVSTLAKVNGRPAVPPRLVQFDTANYITAWYAKDEVRRVPVLREWLGRSYPGVSMPDFISQPQYEDGRLRMVYEVGIR